MVVFAKMNRRVARPLLALAAIVALASCEAPPQPGSLQHPDVIQHAGVAKIPLQVALLVKPTSATLQNHTSFFCKSDFDMPQQDIDLIPVNANFANDALLAFRQAFASAVIPSTAADAKGNDAIFELSLQQIAEQPGCGFSSDRTVTITATIRALSTDGLERWRSALSTGSLTYTPPRTDSVADVLNVQARESSHLEAQLIDAWVTELRATDTSRYAAVDTSAVNAEIAKGDTAMQAGNPQAALSLYVDVLLQSPPGAGFNMDLMTRAIDAALRINPPPAITPQAKQHLSTAEAMLQAASKPSDYESARIEYYRTLQNAPWWADAYADFGTVLEKLGRRNEAAQAVTLYLRAAPNAPDRAAMQAKLVQLQGR